MPAMGHPPILTRDDGDVFIDSDYNTRFDSKGLGRCSWFPFDSSF